MFDNYRSGVLTSRKKIQKARKFRSTVMNNIQLELLNFALIYLKNIKNRASKLCLLIMAFFKRKVPQCGYIRELFTFVFY